MKTALFIFIILFLISSAGWYITYDLSRDKSLASEAQRSVLDERIWRLEDNVATRDTAILKLREKMSSDSLKFSVAQSGLKIEIKTLRRKERLSRRDTVTLTLVDSVYMADDSLILSLTTERNAIREDCRVLTDSLLANVTDLNTIIGLKNEIIIGAHKETAKEKKKGKWYRRGLVTAGAVILYLAIKGD
jgi:hypothetical protein